MLAAPQNRITKPVDVQRTRTLSGNVHRLAQPQYDQGAVDPAMPMNDLVLMMNMSAAQQASLDQLLADQQNPSSKQYHQWLTPEEFGGRFGLSSGDESTVVAWLHSAGFTVKHVSRSHNWIAFGGTAGQVSAALHTSIHKYLVNGEVHYANATNPAVPEALADVTGGFVGLNDFKLQSMIQRISPDLNSGASHYLSPGDFAMIYDLNPLYQAGINGTGMTIAVVGDSDFLPTDISSFRARYGLPVNAPKTFLYGTDPGLNGDEIEVNLDLEWAGAIAPNATIYYVYGPDVFTAIVYAVELNVSQAITISYGYCELNFYNSSYRAVAQQGNAQGITLLAASGDTGAAGCQDRGAFADRGMSVMFPASLPEVTAVGGTQFVEGTGNYWSTTNSSTFTSALSYIPEASWNESSSVGIESTGGGVSILNSKPAWQAGPGVPSDSGRDVPDISFSAAVHDGYYIYYQGVNGAVGGTSASAPSMAGVVALLNQYQVSKGFQTKPGLGNINPQLYRLAQTAPSSFHDITTGNNVVPCAQGSPDCLTGSFGYQAGAAYDQVTGLGSLDVNQFVMNWNMATSAVNVTLTATPTRVTLNDTIQLTATVAAATGTAVPTGTVTFMWDTLPLGSAKLANGSASITFPAYLLLVTGNINLAAEYSGDATFSSGGAIARVQTTLPVGAAAVIPHAPNMVWAQPPDAQGLSWQTTISLSEVAGVPANVTGVTVDGQSQSLAQYFPSPSIPPNGTLTMDVVFRNLAAPVTKTFVFTGVDAMGNQWSRQVSVLYQVQPNYDFFNLSATPLTVVQNTSADPSCQWQVQLNVDDAAGNGIYLIGGLYVGGEDWSDRIPKVFGTERLDAWGGLQGTLCFSNITPPQTEQIEVLLSNTGVYQTVNVTFEAAPATPAKITASPANIVLSAASADKPAQATLSVGISDKTQTWTAAVYPANRTTSWLSLSQLSGTGPAQITLTASGTGFEPAAYRATIVIQSPNAARSISVCQ